MRFDLHGNESNCNVPQKYEKLDFVFRLLMILFNLTPRHEMQSYLSYRRVENCGKKCSLIRLSYIKLQDRTAVLRQRDNHKSMV